MLEKCPGCSGARFGHPGHDEGSKIGVFRKIPSGTEQHPRMGFHWSPFLKLKLSKFSNKETYVPLYLGSKSVFSVISFFSYI